MQTKPSHFKVECSECHATVTQCRCLGPKKITYIVCDACKKKAGK